MQLKYEILFRSCNEKDVAILKYLQNKNVIISLAICKRHKL
jgi:hypothetical protein